MSLLKSHRKHIFFFVIFLGILGAITTLLTYISQQHHQFRHKKIASIQTILLKKPKIEAMTVGSSHSNSIDFSVLGQVGEYMNIGGKDMFEAEYLVNQTLEKIPSLTTIYMAIPYPMLWVDNAKIRPTTRIKHYYSLPKPFLPCINLINLDIVNCIKASLLPITRYDNWEKILVKQEFKHKPFKRRSGSENMTQNFISQRAKHHLTLVQQGSDDIFVNATYHLEKIIQKIQQQKASIVFFTPPYHSDYVQTIAEQNANMINATHKVMFELSQKYNVFYKDYNSIDFPLSGFRNADHLNDKGAELFTNYLKKDIERYTRNNTQKLTNTQY